MRSEQDIKTLYIALTEFLAGTSDPAIQHRISCSLAVLGFILDMTIPNDNATIFEQVLTNYRLEPILTPENIDKIIEEIELQHQNEKIAGRF
jgi:hypothetical protein